MERGNERNDNSDGSDQPMLEDLIDTSSFGDTTRFEQAAAMSSHVVKRDVLSEMLQNKEQFAVFAEMMSRGGQEFDEV